MALKNAIRKGDTTTHGGVVLEGINNMPVLGIPVACKGHMVHCPKCKGTYPIIEGISSMPIAGKMPAVEGMMTACGAVLIASQSQFKLVQINDNTITPEQFQAAQFQHTQNENYASNTIGYENSLITDTPPLQHREYLYNIEKNVHNSNINPDAKPPATLAEAKRVMKQVSILKLLDNNTNHYAEIKGISADIGGEAVTYEEGRSIKISPTAFTSYANLALVIGHELIHVLHHQSGDFNKWKKKGADYAKSATEYEAWWWTWGQVNKSTFAYGVYERYKGWRSKFITNGGKPYD